jgi:drug/metabolite transporter (DMT)-like permease
MSIYVQLIIASLFWGMNVIVMKLLLSKIPFLLLAVLRVFLSAICLFIYMKIKHEYIKIGRINDILFVSLFGIYFNFLCTFSSMNEIKGVDNAFINALSPMITITISLLFHKHISKSEMVAVIISVFAFLLSIRFNVFSLKLGFYIMLLGIVCYIISHVYIQYKNIEHSYSFILFQLIFGALFLFIHCIFMKQFDIICLNKIDFSYWMLFIVVSGIGFAYIQVVYMKAVKEIGALKTSFFLSLNPIVTYISSVFILNEAIDFIHILSFIMIIISILISYFSNLIHK